MPEKNNKRITKIYQFKFARVEENRTLRDVVTLPGLKIRRKTVMLEALALYEHFNVDFLDAYNAADIRASGLSAVCSYDTHFPRLGVTRVEPGQGV